MSNYEDLKAIAKQKIILNDKGLPLVFLGVRIKIHGRFGYWIRTRTTPGV